MQQLDKNINLEMKPLIEASYADLENQGYATFHTNGLTKDNFLTLSYSYGEVILPGRGDDFVTDIYTDKKKGSLPLPLHTDKSYWRIPPRYELLYVCDIAEMKKGELLVSDLQQAFDALSESEQIELINYCPTYRLPSNRDTGETKAKLVNFINGDLAFFRFRLDLFDSAIPAVKKWSALVEGNSELVEYQKGDIIALDNWRHAAGRKESCFGERGFRHIYRTLVM